ncbi:MAG: hypothetical protein WBW06_13025, partial [Xanthobacteraceae bacterium]
GWTARAVAPTEIALFDFGILSTKSAKADSAGPLRGHLRVTGHIKHEPLLVGLALTLFAAL